MVKIVIKEHYAFLVRLDIKDPVEKQIQQKINKLAIELGVSESRIVIQILQSYFMDDIIL